MLVRPLALCHVYESLCMTKIRNPFIILWQAVWTQSAQASTVLLVVAQQMVVVLLLPCWRPLVGALGLFAWDGLLMIKCTSASRCRQMAALLLQSCSVKHHWLPLPLLLIPAAAYDGPGKAPQGSKAAGGGKAKASSSSTGARKSSPASAAQLAKGSKRVEAFTPGAVEGPRSEDCCDA